MLFYLYCLLLSYEKIIHLIFVIGHLIVVDTFFQEPQLCVTDRSDCTLCRIVTQQILFQGPIFFNLQVRNLLTLICIKWIPRDPSTIFLVATFTQKMPESSNSMYSSILMIQPFYHQTYDSIILPKVDRIHKRL